MHTTNCILQGKYKKPNDTYTQDFYMPETAKGNIDTFIDGLKNAERKPTSKTPFVATITDKDGNKTRRTLTTVSYQSSNEEELKINDAILHEAGTSVRCAYYDCIRFFSTNLTPRDM